MAKFGVFIRIDIEADSAEKANDIAIDVLSYCDGAVQNIKDWEINNIEKA